MHAFTQRLAQRIEQPEDETIADSLIDAGEMMRMWRFFAGDPGGSAVVGPLDSWERVLEIVAETKELSLTRNDERSFTLSPK